MENHCKIERLEIKKLEIVLGAAPKPEGEAARLSALRSYNILDTLPEVEFDDIVQLASKICDVPIALVSLVDGERQWFKARTGLHAQETHRDLAFCAHAILDPGEPLIVEDATQDARFLDNPLVTGDPDIRFYAGQPLLSPEGEALGTLCAIDTKPRKLEADQIAALKTLSSHVVLLLEKRKTEADLLLERERLKLAETSAKIGHWELDVTTKRVFWSDQVYALHGITRDEFNPSLNPAIDFYHPDDRTLVETSVNNAIEIQAPYEFEARLIQRGGNEINVRSTGRPRFDRSGNLVSIFGVIQDISESVHTAQKLKQANDFQELMFLNMPDLVFVKDEQFRIVSANPAFLEVYPKEKRDKIIGYTTVEEYNKEEADAFLERDREAFENGYSETREKLKFPDGKTRSLFTKKIRFENDNGDGFILALATDVTERENLIERLVASNEELERFAYICSHDLQEPLRMIRSFSTRLQEHLGEKLEGDELGQKYFHFVIDGAERAQMLISDVLSYSSLDSDTSSYDEVNTADLVDLISTTLRGNQSDRDIEIQTEQLPKISGNKTQIYQLFQNLIENALKYQKNDSLPIVQIGAIEEGEYCKFYIKDNGIGIEPRHQRKIFEVFKRLHRRDQYPGTGVGLSICKKIVERHGGNIWVESEKGEGATFYFTLLKRMPSGALS